MVSKNMIALKKLSNIIWLNRRTIDFGCAMSWDEDTFLQTWVRQKDEKAWANLPGWYWFESDLTLEELEYLELPLSLPKKATKFNQVALFNKMRLAPSDIFRPKGDELNVVYSGQEGRVFSRLRIHFSLTEKNTGTGALGISKYPLSDRRWRASFFHEGMIDQVPDIKQEDRNSLRVLISEKHNRDLLETCWRIEHGWPALCIK
ncbi:MULTISPECIES: hypothetical protein [Pseudomonas]|nr:MULTISPECIES: hypothetical protein [Pseudomonas]MCX9139539.1 hypothetical protein [Pseudomonas sp. DCB_PUT]MDD1972534.1 hypothetical protein [Pseudomonas putida]MDO1465781.1 hypothetical protein [Pseudomonas putida]MDO1471151.1 hypothetical protein [Pseudomonas putida]MDZ7329358.1 hypothetical protein [Pseudomonas sp. SDS3-8]